MYRYREFSNFSETSTMPYLISHSNDSSWYAGPTKAYVKTQYYSAIRDAPVPNFRKRSAAGEIINNGMLRVAIRNEFTPTLLKSLGPHTYPPGVVTYHDGWVIPPYFEPSQFFNCDEFIWDAYMSPAASDRSRVINSSWANIDVSEYQGAAALGELPETLAWIASLYKRSIPILKSVRKKNLIKTTRKLYKSMTSKQKTDMVSNFYLEARYAIRPLVYDATDAIKALKASIDKNSRKTARSKDVDVAIERHTYFTPEYGQIGRLPVSRTIVTTTTLRGGVLFHISDDINSMMALWGMDQQIEAVWEIIPGSFIFDWFFNIGDTISAWSIAPGVSPLTSWLTESVRQVVTDTTTGILNEKTYPYICTTQCLKTPGQTKGVLVYKRRYPNPSRAIMPTFNLKLDVTKLVDLAAIGRQLLLVK